MTYFGKLEFKAYLDWQRVRKLASTVFLTNEDSPFHLWQNKNLVKYQKVLKHYDHYFTLEVHSWEDYVHGKA